MEKIKIVTDSTVDLSNEMIQHYNIEVVPLSITINNETFLDRVDITPSQFLQKMKDSKELPKSSQPAVGQFLEVYNRLGQDGSKIISIHMSGGMSGTVSSAENAAKLTDSEVSIVDSRFISKALSFQVIEAAKMAQKGKWIDEIINRLHVIRENTQLFAVVDTLENLVKGGRIGRGKALIGSLLNIKPIASLADGVYTPVAKVRSYSQVIKYLTRQFSEDTEGKVIKGIGIAHADAVELANRLKEAITRATDFLDIDIIETTPIITTHTGRGTIAFMYYAD